MQARKLNNVISLSKKFFERTGFKNKKYFTVSSKSCTKKREKLTISYDHGVSSQKLLYKTIGQVLDETTDLFPDNEAIVFSNDNIRLTYAEFTRKVDTFASGLLALGLQIGDRIGIWGHNHLEWLLTFYAASRAGLILVNINPSYQSAELEYALKKVEIKAIVLMPSFKTSDYYEMLCNVVPELRLSQPGQLRSEKVPYLTDVIMTEGPALPGTFAFSEVCELGGYHERHELVRLKDEIQADQPVNIQFTSGTTGNPKGATLTHHNLVNNGLTIGRVLGYDQKVDVHACVATTHACIPIPLYHCFSITAGSLCCVLNGSTQVYPDRGFNAHSTLKSIHDERCNTILGAPVMFIDMLNHPDFHKYDCTSLYTGVMGGAPCPVEIMKKIITDMHCKEMMCGYGLTETSPAACVSTRDSSMELRTTTVGQVVEHVEVKVVDENNKIVPINEPGELCFRGYNILHSYWQDEIKTKAAVDPNGWFHTGDLGVLDEDGYCQIVGRLKDMIVRGGENIYPTEIENFLHKHPSIVDIQIVGLPDERMGEEVCAWIKLKPNVVCDENDIKEYCKGKISHYKIPRYIRFVEEFPLTVTGKVKKFVIRNEMLDYLKDLNLQ